MNTPLSAAMCGFVHRGCVYIKLGFIFVFLLGGAIYCLLAFALALPPSLPFLCVFFGCSPCHLELFIVYPCLFRCPVVATLVRPGSDRPLIRRRGWQALWETVQSAHCTGVGLLSHTRPVERRPAPGFSLVILFWTTKHLSSILHPLLARKY